MNVTGCVDAIKNWAESEGMQGYRIGYVTGDDIKDQIPRLLKEGWTFPNFDYDGDFHSILDKIYNCNAYIGHEGIEACLEQDADVVITGRAADSALFLAPLKHEFGWAADDWDKPGPRHHGRPSAGMRRPGRRRQLYVRLARRAPHGRAGLPHCRADRRHL